MDAELRDYWRQVNRLAGERETSRRAFLGGVWRYRRRGVPIWVGSPTVVDGADRIRFSPGGGAAGALRVGLGDFGLTSAADTSLVRVRPGATFVCEGQVSLQRGVRVVVDAGELRIGHGTNVNGLGTKILVGESVTIGAGCTFSWDVQVLDHDFHTMTVDGVPRPESAPVTIGDRVWVGTGATVLKGVEIGHDSVVAAGAVVTRSAPPHSVLAGSPARVVSQVDSWT